MNNQLISTMRSEALRLRSHARAEVREAETLEEAVRLLSPPLKKVPVAEQPPIKRKVGRPRKIA